MSHLENDESVKIARALLSPSLIYESKLLRRLEIGIGHGPIASPRLVHLHNPLFSKFLGVESHSKVSESRRSKRQ